MLPLNRQRTACFNDAKHSCLLLLLDGGPQQQRLQKGVAKTDISKPGLLHVYTQGEMIKFGTIATIGAGNPA